MPRKSKKPVRKQTHSPTGKVVGQVGQILLPMIAGIAATKADLTEWVYEQGLTALHPTAQRGPPRRGRGTEGQARGRSELITTGGARTES